MPETQSTATLPPEIEILLRNQRDKDQQRLFVMDFIQKSDALRDLFTEIWDEILDNYFVTPMGMRVGSKKAVLRWWGSTELVRPPARQMQARLKDPETHQMVEALVAQGLGLIFTDNEYIKVVPLGLDDPDKARLLQRLITAVLDQPGNFRTFYQIFKESFMLGTSVMQIGWDTRERRQMLPQPVFDEFGGFAGTGMSPEDVIYRDQPLIESVDLYDFYPDPSGTRIQRDMSGVAKRFRLTRGHARDLAAAGVYDKAAVEAAIAGIEHGEKRDSKGIGGAERMEGFARDTAKGLEPLVGFEYWGKYPFPTQDGASNRVITVLEGVVVRSHINPFMDGGIPFKEVTTNPVQGRFYGLSPAEVNRFIQDAADHFLMVSNDAADLMTRMPLLMGSAFGGDTKALRDRRFNDIIECRNPDMVKPLPIDTNALTLAAAQRVSMKQTMRESSGFTDPMQAIPSATRKTATEVSEIVRFATQRVEMMATLIERNDMPWVGRMLHSRLRQFLPDGGALTVLNGEPLRVPFEAVDFDADVRFVGSRHAISKFQEVAQLREAISVLGGAPEIAAAFPKLVERLLDKMDIPDAALMVMQAQQMLAQQQMMGQNTSGSGSKSPERGQSLGTETGAAEREGRRMS